VTLLELSAQRSGVEAFGLRMAETRRTSNLGPLMLFVRDEPTLRQAVNAMARFGHLHNEAMFLSVEEDAGLAIIREELLSGEAIPMRQATELALAVMLRLLRFFLGENWRPKTICFAHGAPKSRAVHARVFGAKMEFSQPFTGIVCDARDLDVPMPSADPVMGQYVRRYLGSPDAHTSTHMSNEVRQLMLLLLPSGRSSIDYIARQMGVSRRTIHRHLAEENLTFSSILDAVRSELAMRYLDRRERPLSEVAGLLGFSESSAFSRWFRATFGSSPTQFQASREKPRARRRNPGNKGVPAKPAGNSR
jgi:AraC-like DNA-binding protein